MNEKVADMNPVKGLEFLLAPGKGNNWIHLDDCHEHITRLDAHPFGLELPPAELGFGRREIILVGANCAVEMAVRIFLANIRYYIGAQKDTHPTMLRIISTPFSNKPDGRHYVFFEIQIGNMNILSSETTDCSGAGNEGRQEIEDVFALLSLLYRIEINRVNIMKKVNLLGLCAEQCVV